MMHWEYVNAMGSHETLGSHSVFISHDVSGWHHSVGITLIMCLDLMKHWGLIIYYKGVGSNDVTGNLQIYVI